MSYGARNAPTVRTTVLPCQRRAWIMGPEVVFEIFEIYAVNSDSWPMVQHNAGRSDKPAETGAPT